MDGENVLRNVTISGSYRKFPEEIEKLIEAFKDFGVSVLSPHSATIIGSVDGFVSLVGDIVPRIDEVPDSCLVDAIRLVENSHLQAIQQSDALWLAAPDGYFGISTAFEAGWSLAHNIPVFYDRKYFGHVKEPIIMAYAIPTKGVEDLVHNFKSMPRVDPSVSRYFMKSFISTKISEKDSSRFNADVAVGPVIVDYSEKNYRSGQPRDILLVKTHKWGGRFSIVGGRMRRGEGIYDPFSRIVFEQTGLDCSIGDDICVFDEIRDSGYHEAGSSRIFVDKVVAVRSRSVKLDERAEEYAWATPYVALRDFDLEPNARKTIELYHRDRCFYA